MEAVAYVTALLSFCTWVWDHLANGGGLSGTEKYDEVLATRRLGTDESKEDSSTASGVDEHDEASSAANSTAS